MVIKGEIKKGEYFDSVTLMIVAQEIDKIDGVEDSAVVMATPENRSILESSNLLLAEFAQATGSDLLIAVQAESEERAQQALQQVDKILQEVRNNQDETEQATPRSLESALQLLPHANLELISIPGKYAAKEAFKALHKGLNVMLFSDNVALADEVELKKYARENGLFVMGPDCGTAIINGIPLAFANVVKRGNIGLVAASGTGLQEVSSIISQQGEGISQALGTGGRDIKKEVGGSTFLQSMEALSQDENTDIIVLIAKPPAAPVLRKILDKSRQIKKPIVALFMGGKKLDSDIPNFFLTKTLEEAALTAVALVQKKEEGFYKKSIIANRKEFLTQKASALSRNLQPQQKYIRGLFSGGTLCQEAELILDEFINNVYSNVTSKQKFALADATQSRQNTVVDMGADEFTLGRPHPMIDYSQRRARLKIEAQAEEVAVILFDLVLGYGSNLQPAAELVPLLTQLKQEAKQQGRDIIFICSLTGTDEDPQNRENLKKKLTEVGVEVMDSNAAAAELAGRIIKEIWQES